jgi:four helix bundle protein
MTIRGGMETKPDHAISFFRLWIYEEACALDDRIFQASKLWPHDERYALIDQIRRSSRAIGANLAEAWAKRRYRAHFLSKLTDADGELQETRHWLGRAEFYGDLASAERRRIDSQCLLLGRRLGATMKNAASFCSPDYAPGNR